LAGIQTEAAKNLNYLNQLTEGWKQQGLSQPEIDKKRAEARVSLKIPDTNDPVYQAQIIENQINQKKLAGQPVGYDEMAKYLQAIKDAGGVSIVAPEGEKYTNGKYTVTTSGDSVIVNAQDGTNGGQCGRFVNNYLGTSIFGDNYTTGKATFINSTAPVVGSIAIMSPENVGNKWGHVGVVQSIDLNSGMVTLKDSNWVGNNEGKKEQIGTHQVSINSINGYYVPKNGKQTGNIGASPLSPTAKEVMSNPSLLGNYTAKRKGEILDELTRAGVSLGSVATPEQVKLLNQMNDDVRSEPLYKQNVEIQNGYQNVTIGADLNNAQGDLAIVNGFAKMLDPTGVVRPEEFKTVEEAQSFFERFKTLPAKYIEGDSLHPDARIKFADAAKKLYGEKIKSFNKLIDTKYIPTAEFSGVPLKLVENLKAPTLDRLITEDVTKDSPDYWYNNYDPQKEALYNKYLMPQ